ncbi:hypothetical protein CKA38_14330 [Ereboglobus luteus]|uniref:Sialidase domain-containing protein n=2 Tax=Ereboglobus luteus TaxID=1796921 RepID=A0A2U8E706_9BACT|nr:hypothetical protein CKA38_14330 [Ereboglobus luteus]
MLRAPCALFIIHFSLFISGGIAAAHVVSLLSPRANTRSDQRPINIGFYDAGANKTFVTWMGANSTAVVKELDHATGMWSADKVAGTSSFVDKHNYPGMLRGPDGRIHIFYGCHNSPLRHTVSPKPLSIEGEWDDRVIEVSHGASYPAPVITSEGVFYVFFRDTRRTNGYSDDRPYQMVKSADGGKTWTRHMIADPFGRATDNMCEVYNGKVTYQPASADGKQPARIHIAWTIAGEKLGRHAHATYGRNVYYAWLNPANDHLYNIEGRDLGTHIDNKEMDEHCLVLDTGIPEKGHRAGLMVSAHYRDNGAPLIVFDSYHHNGLSSATWDAAKREWRFTRIAGHIDPRETEKTGPDSFRVYRPEGRAVRIYETTDGGAQWREAGVIAIPENLGEVDFVDNARGGQSGKTTPRKVRSAIDRIHVIDNAHPDAKFLLTQSGDGTIREAKRNVYIVRQSR